MSNYFYLLLLANVLFLGCNDSSPVIEVEESDILPFTKQDSVSQAQAGLRDSLKAEGWYSFNTFGSINIEYNGFEDYHYGALVPPTVDSIFSSSGFLFYVLRIEYEYENNQLGAMYPCTSDTPGSDCLERYSYLNYPDNAEFLIDKKDTTGFFTLGNNQFENRNTLLLHLPLPNDSSRMGLVYTIWYDIELENTALAMARSAHKYR